jgi:hypothetical protein
VIPHLSPSDRRAVRNFWNDFARRHGFADYEAMSDSNMTPVEVIRWRIESSPRDLADLFTSADLYGMPQVGAALLSVVQRDDQHACDLLREVLGPLIDAEVDKRAKAEGVGDYFDVDGVLAA